MNERCNVSFSECIDEVYEEELTLINEIEKVHAAISPLGMLARRLDSGKISREEAAVALRGIVILLNHKIDEIVEVTRDNN